MFSFSNGNGVFEVKGLDIETMVEDGVMRGVIKSLGSCVMSRVLMLGD